MLKDLASGEVVTATRIDRLARSTFDLFAIVKRIVDAGGQFRSLAEPWADTSTSTERLMIAVLGGLAYVERDPILAYLPKTSPNASAGIGRLPRRRIAVPGRTALSRIAIGFPFGSNLIA